MVLEKHKLTNREAERRIDENLSCEIGVLPPGMYTDYTGEFFELIDNEKPRIVGNTVKEKGIEARLWESTPEEQSKDRKIFGDKATLGWRLMVSHGSKTKVLPILGTQEENTNVSYKVGLLFEEAIHTYDPTLTGNEHLRKEIIDNEIPYLFISPNPEANVVDKVVLPDNHSSGTLVYRLLRDSTIAVTTQNIPNGRLGILRKEWKKDWFEEYDLFRYLNREKEEDI